MFGRNTFRMAILIVSALSAPQLLAQPTTDAQDKPRKIRREPHKAFPDWRKEVDPILPKSQADAWDKLKTDDEREQFIIEFWRQRDPDPDTEENEYREAYYERLAYVNEHFSSGIPGYKTDRGRIYLKYGKPDSIESHPSGGTYQREYHEGGGSTSTYPFERWWYRHLPGRSDVDIEFVDPTGTGEYRIARNPFEKEANLRVPGASPTTDGRSQSDRVDAASGFGNPFSGRAKDSAFEWMELLKLRDAPPEGNFDRLVGAGTSSPIIDDNSLNPNIQVSFFRQSNDRVIVAFTVQTDNRDLVFRDVGGIQTARVNIAGRITSVAGRRVGFFEDVVTTTSTTAELTESRERRAAYQKALPMLPGRYRVDLIVRDVNSGAAGVQHLGFEVPKFGDQLASSSLVLASVLEQISDVPASRQFVIGDKKVIPNLTGTFHRGKPIGVYMQIYNTGIDQTTLRPSVDVEYVLMKDGKELGKQIEDWRGNSDSGQRLTLARLLDSRDLNPGEYAIEVRVRDRVSGQTLLQSAKFSIVG
ncbi:MAG TPA: GWxTD domain-containing protein [Pyrinomonadaceae bacterium]|nr:GWxTD domain-containing protein [Pyrinomonadaceae bacterium]